MDKGKRDLMYAVSVRVDYLEGVMKAAELESYLKAVHGLCINNKKMYDLLSKVEIKQLEFIKERLEIKYNEERQRHIYEKKRNKLLGTCSIQLLNTMCLNSTEGNWIFTLEDISRIVEEPVDEGFLSDLSSYLQEHFSYLILDVSVNAEGLDVMIGTDFIINEEDEEDGLDDCDSFYAEPFEN